MTRSSEDKIQNALRPIASLISKSEKAQRKLAENTWQHAMLRDNLKALRAALALMTRPADDAHGFTPHDLQDALRSLSSMIRKTLKARAAFPRGTSQHTLQRNRLAALQAAEAVIKAAQPGHRAAKRTRNHETRAPAASESGRHPRGTSTRDDFSTRNRQRPTMRRRGRRQP